MMVCATWSVRFADERSVCFPPLARQLLLRYRRRDRVPAREGGAGRRGRAARCREQAFASSTPAPRLEAVDQEPRPVHPGEQAQRTQHGPQRLLEGDVFDREADGPVRVAAAA